MTSCRNANDQSKNCAKLTAEKFCRPFQVSDDVAPEINGPAEVNDINIKNYWK